MSETEKPNVGAGKETNTKTRKRSWRWRFLRFVVLSFAGLVTLFFLFHAEENWRGKRAWEKYRKEQEAKGVSFDFNSVVPPPVPDDKNFAMTPLLKPLLELNPPGAKKRFKDMAGYERTDIQLQPLPWSKSTTMVRDFPQWRSGWRFNLADWQAAIFDSTNFLHHVEKGMPGDDVLYALTQYEAALTELQIAARTRPFSRFPVHYEEEDKAGILLPHLARIKGFSKVFQLRAVAELSLGKSDQAFADVNTMFTLADSIQTEPFIISKLVRYVCFQIAVQTIWEGLLDHRWKPEHLAYWQQKLAAYDFVKDGYRGMQGEQAFGNSIIEFLRKYPYMLDKIGQNDDVNLPASSGFERCLYKLIPSGWFYQEQITYNRLYNDYILDSKAKDKALLDVKQVRETRDRMEKVFFHRDTFTEIKEHRVLVHILMPSMASFIQKSAYTQSTADLAMVAMALERYRQLHQDYPSTLDGLGSDSLPVDILAKKPFRYERQSKDSFRLWSIGWNLKDDGGLIARRSDSPSASIKIEEGDWTWPQVKME